MTCNETDPVFAGARQCHLAGHPWLFVHKVQMRPKVPLSRRASESVLRSREKIQIVCSVPLNTPRGRAQFQKTLREPRRQTTAEVPALSSAGFKITAI